MGHQRIRRSEHSGQNGSDTRVGVDPHGPDRVLQQATVNLFADMGAQPATLEEGPVAAEASGDDEAPMSSVDTVSLVRGESTVTNLVTGSASDGGGGVVAAVEVSVDGGATWHPARGREKWRYSWQPDAATTEVSIRVRAVDDSGNLEVPGEGLMVRVGASAPDSP